MKIYIEYNSDCQRWHKRKPTTNLLAIAEATEAEEPDSFPDRSESSLPFIGEVGYCNGVGWVKIEEILEHTPIIETVLDYFDSLNPLDLPSVDKFLAFLVEQNNAFNTIFDRFIVREKELLLIGEDHSTLFVLEKRELVLKEKELIEQLSQFPEDLPILTTTSRTTK